MDQLFLNSIQAIEDDWLSASKAMMRAEADTSRAMMDYRRDRCASAYARLAGAIEARDAAAQRLRALMHAVWDCAT